MAYQLGDDERFVAFLTRLATGADLRARLARAGRKTTGREFDRTRLAVELIPIYHEALRAEN